MCQLTLILTLTLTRFTLSVQEQPPWVGCWMTDAIAPQRPPIDIDARDGTPRVAAGSGWMSLTG